MARYGGEYGRGGHGYGWSGEHGGGHWGYGSEYGRPRRRMFRPRISRGYEPGMGFEGGEHRRRGFPGGAGYGHEYGEYDYDYGGRGWPYGRSRRGMRGRGRFGYEYDWEMGGTEGFGMPYGSEYTRGGTPGFGRRDMPGGMRGGYRGGMAGYGSEYGDRTYAERFTGRYADRGEEFGPAEAPYGRTPSDRWPEMGHDVDNLSRREMRMSDDEIREAVLENLFQDTWVDPQRIDVEVENGVVTLSGEVNDFMEARYAWDDAWETAGVRGVINNLTVRTDQPSEQMDMPQTSGSRRSR